MRLLLVLGLLTTCSAPSGATPPEPTGPRVPSWRPRAWQPPVRVATAGASLRWSPDDGTTETPAAELQALGAARRKALENVVVTRRPDGSRHAVLGGLIRAYTVVHVGADGRLAQECVHSEEQARRRVQAPAPGSAPACEHAPAAATAGSRER